MFYTFCFPLSLRRFFFHARQPWKFLFSPWNLEIPWCIACAIYFFVFFVHLSFCVEFLVFSLWVYSNLTTEKNRKGRVKFVYFYGNGERKNRIEKYYRAPTPTIFIVFGICFFSGKKKKEISHSSPNWSNCRFFVYCVTLGKRKFENSMGENRVVITGALHFPVLQAFRLSFFFCALYLLFWYKVKLDFKWRYYSPQFFFLEKLCEDSFGARLSGNAGRCCGYWLISDLHLEWIADWNKRLSFQLIHCTIGRGSDWQRETRKSKISNLTGNVVKPDLFIIHL